MKQIKKSSEILWLLGILFVALGVAICDKANLGVSMIAAPAFIISEALSPISTFFSVGASEYLIQGLLLLLMCAIIRKFLLDRALTLFDTDFFNGILAFANTRRIRQAKKHFA